VDGYASAPRHAVAPEGANRLADRNNAAKCPRRRSVLFPGPRQSAGLQAAACEGGLSKPSVGAMNSKDK
jgi:hypothetical protein